MSTCGEKGHWGVLLEGQDTGTESLILPDQQLCPDNDMETWVPLPATGTYLRIAPGVPVVGLASPFSPDNFGKFLVSVLDRHWGFSHTPG